MGTTELVVVGQDKIDIELERKPCHVDVHFKHPHHIHPCNPKHFDELNFSIKEKHHHGHIKFYVEISWNVSGLREIECKVKY